MNFFPSIFQNEQFYTCPNEPYCLKKEEGNPSKGTNLRTIRFSEKFSKFVTANFIEKNFENF